MNRHDVHSNPALIGRLLAAARQNAEQLAAIDDSDRPALPLGTPAMSDSDGGFGGTSGAVSIPGYQIVCEIHRGGQGVVYQAIRESNGEDVAIKVLHDRRAASPRELERFDREFGVLRELNHPNLIAVSLVGVVDGRPFLIMPYIPGWPLDEHVRRNGLSVRETLVLFLKVCDAVNVAHLNGVIHRDIKPSNIRVDDAGEPHVLDFGLAKSVNSTPGESLTETGQFVGSLPWASPEQADPSLGRVDVRTDVYSLGAVLYQLLTGKLPIDPIGSQREVLNRIVSAEPPSPRLLRHEINDEVETIILKCLSKDRARRYSNADGLATDIRRYLAGEAIEAKHDSRWYVMRKFVRRNRAAVVAAGVVGLVLVAATGVSIRYGQYEAAARLGETEALNREREQRELAEKREKQTQQVSEFQAKMLYEIDLEAMGRGIKQRFREQVRAALQRQYVGDFPDRRERTAGEVEAELAAFDQRADAIEAADVARQAMDEFVLARAANALEKRFADQPLVQAQLHDAIASAYRDLGHYDAAEPHFRKALEIRQRELGEHELVADSLLCMAQVLAAKNDLAAAEPLFREALAMFRRRMGDEHPGVAVYLSNLADALAGRADYAEAERLLREAWAVRRKLLGDVHPDVATSLDNLADLLWKKGDNNAAEIPLREALAMRRKLWGDEHPEVATNLHCLGRLLKDRGDYAAAEPLLRDALAMRQKLLGDEHRDVGISLDALAGLFERKRDYTAAESLYLEALALSQRRFGKEHPDVAISLNNLAHLLWMKGDYDAAESLFREALVIRRKLLGDEHPDVAHTLNNLAVVLGDKGDYDAAEPLLREALAMRRKLLGDEHLDIAESLDNLAELLGFRKGELSEAEELYRESLAIRRKLLGNEHLDVARSLNNLANLLNQKGDYDAAEPLYCEILEIRRKLLGDVHPQVARSLANLATVLWYNKGDALAAEPLFREAVEIRRKLMDDGPDRENNVAGLLFALNNLAGLVEEEKNDHSGAELLLREGLSIARKQLEGDGAQSALFLHHLARCLEETGKSAEALPLARESVAIYRQLPKRNDSEYAHALQVLAEVLRVRHDFDEAEKLGRESVEFYRSKKIRSEVAHHRQAAKVLSQTLVDAGKTDEAIRIQREFVEDCRRLLPADNTALASDLASFGLMLLQQDKHAEAEPVLRECLAIRERALQPDSPSYWLLPNTRSMLGGALAGQGAALIESDAPAAISKFNEAEPLLVESGTWLTRSADGIPQNSRAERLRLAVERIAKLYESWDTVAPDTGKADQAAKWRAELEKLSGP